MSDAPRVSLVICTHNRAALLDQTVQAVQAAIAHAPDRFELLVVDNASTDDTPAVARRRGVRLVAEPTVGLTHARNTGVEAARAPWVWFLDDDIAPHAGWADAVLRAVEQTGVGLIAGRILLRWPDREPAWLPPELRGSYSALDLGAEPGPLAWPRFPFGANMGVRRDVYTAAGGCLPELGRQGRVLLSNEDKDLAHRIHLAGVRSWYAGDAAVDHLVDPSRRSIAWLLRRSYWGGVSDVRGARLRAERGAETSGQAGRRWLRNNLAATVLGAFTGRRGIVRLAARASYIAGVLRGRRY